MARKMRTQVGLLAVLVLLGACNSQLARGSGVPALISSDDPENLRRGQAELRRILSAALDQESVPLAADALTETSILVLERNPPRGIQQPPIGGREMTPPLRFQLLVGEKGCWLRQLPDGDRWQLRGVQCKPAP